jgi:hypothetical protein
VSALLGQLLAGKKQIADENQKDLKALVTADREALRMLTFVGALPDSGTTCDDFERAVIAVGAHYDLDEHVTAMREWLKSRGIDIDFDINETDMIFPVSMAEKQAAYVLGLAVGLRLADSAGGRLRGR